MNICVSSVDILNGFNNGPLTQNPLRFHITYGIFTVLLFFKMPEFLACNSGSSCFDKDARLHRENSSFLSGPKFKPH